jgi:hypothetical protein
MNDSSGILGVIVGALIVIGVIWFAFGERLGLREPGPSVKVELPKTNK